MVKIFGQCVVCVERGLSKVAHSFEEKAKDNVPLILRAGRYLVRLGVGGEHFGGELLHFFFVENLLGKGARTAKDFVEISFSAGEDLQGFRVSFFDVFRMTKDET